TDMRGRISLRNATVRLKRQQPDVLRSRESHVLLELQSPRSIADNDDHCVRRRARDDFRNTNEDLETLSQADIAGVKREKLAGEIIFLREASLVRRRFYPIDINEVGSEEELRPR